MSKPCPFCGFKDEPGLDWDSHGVAAVCLRCGARGPEIETSDDQPSRDDDADANAAIAIWNHRNG